jgi:hypothetical protein
MHGTFPKFSLFQKRHVYHIHLKEWKMFYIATCVIIDEVWIGNLIY